MGKTVFEWKLSLISGRRWHDYFLYSSVPNILAFLDLCCLEHRRNSVIQHGIFRLITSKKCNLILNKKRSTFGSI